MKRRMATLAFVLLLVSLLTACGDRMNAENTVTPLPAATATTMPRVSAAPSATALPKQTDSPTAEDGVVTDENGIIGDEAKPNSDNKGGAANDMLEDAEEGLDRAENKVENGLDNAAGVVR